MTNTFFNNSQSLSCFLFLSSRKILENLVDFDLTDNDLPAYSSRAGHFIHQHSEESCLIRLIRVSFVGELGYEIHAASEDCRYIYEKIMNVGRELGLKNAGYRALYSLSCEKGLRHPYDHFVVIIN